MRNVNISFLLSYFLVIHCSVFGQFKNRKFSEQLKVIPLQDTLSEISIEKPSTDVVNFKKDSIAIYQTIVLNTILSNAKNKNNLKESKVLNVLSTICANEMSGHFSGKYRRIMYARKRIKKLFVKANCSFSSLHSFTFEVDVLKDPGTYFYDESIGASDFHLYKGTQKAYEKDSVSPKPLDFYTEKELEKLILRKTASQKIKRILNNKDVSSVGISIVPMRKKPRRNKIQKLKVVVILGEKQLGRIKR